MAVAKILSDLAKKIFWGKVKYLGVATVKTSISMVNVEALKKDIQIYSDLDNIPASIKNYGGRFSTPCDDMSLFPF